MRSKCYLALLVTTLGIVALGFSQEHRDKIRFCYVGPNDLVDVSAPKFEQYHVRTSPPLRSVPKLDLQSDPIARMYRTVIRREMKEGPNFADHYRVVTWGCGSSCAQFAVVNLVDGRVITAEGVDNVSGVHVAADGFLPNADSRDWSFRFKRDSRLLVVVGAINEDDSNEGAFYYELKRDRLKLVHKTIAARNTCQEESE